MRGTTCAGIITTLGVVILACGRDGGVAPPCSTCPPSVSAAPQDATIEACSGASFTVQADGTPPLEYQWLHDGSPIADATASRYDIPRAGAADGGAYSVLVTNAFGATTGYVMTVDREGGDPVTLAAQPGLTLQLAVDSLFVYWTSNSRPGSTGTGSVWKAPRDGSQPPTLLASGLDAPFDIAVDPQYVYWGERTRIVRMPK